MMSDVSAFVSYITSGDRQTSIDELDAGPSYRVSTPIVHSINSRPTMFCKGKKYQLRSRKNVPVIRLQHIMRNVRGLCDDKHNEKQISSYVYWAKDLQ